MVFGTIFEMVGAIAVGARTADTIKNGIIPNSAFKGDAGVQMLAFTCALAAASSWVMWCTKHSTHVSSTYSLVSAVAGVGVATVGAKNVQWGWNNGKGMGAIFSGLVIAPIAAAGFGASIFMLIKVVVHMRSNPIPWSVYTSPFFFLVAATICTLSIVYKGSPKLHLNKKPAWYVASVTVGTGVGVCVLAAIFFMPFLYARVIKKDNSVKWWMFIYGPALMFRPTVNESDTANVPDYAVVQHDPDMDSDFGSHKSVSDYDPKGNDSDEIKISTATGDPEKATGAPEKTYQELLKEGREKFHSKLRKKKGPLGWAMRLLHDNPIGSGEIYEIQNLKILAKRIPAMVVVALLYGIHYDIHAAQSGIHGTPEGKRMAIVYSHAKKYPNEVEHAYSFIQILTACTASFAHGANDIGNSVGPWAVIYSAWHTGNAAASKAPVPIWQLAVLSATISVGLITYGYNIMKGKLSLLLIHKHTR
jgi:sodium-dependent phosphate transporter